MNISFKVWEYSSAISKIPKACINDPLRKVENLSVTTEMSMILIFLLTFIERQSISFKLKACTDKT